jgi:4-hydroxy-3-methylbut-2-en-1-yl diphosphate reductase
MRFSASVLLCLAATNSVATAFAPAIAFRPKTTTTTTLVSLQQSTTSAETEQVEAATEETKERKSTKKDERLRMMKSDQFHRMGFKEVRKEVEGRMQSEFQSQLVGELKSNNYVMERDGVKVYLAKVRNP